MVGRNISPPIIDEPVYACAGALVVSGYIAGAAIDIFLSPPPSGQGPGSSPTRIGGGISYSEIGQVFVVDATQVIDGATIYATQSLGGTKSPPSATVTVQSMPPTSSPSRPQLNPPLLECATCVRVDAAIPGSRVEVLDAARSIGSGLAGGATLDIDLTAPLVASHLISAHDVYCGQGLPPSPSVGGVVPTRGHVKDRLFLPVPRIEEPVYACQRYVTVSGCRPGCTVGISIDRGRAQQSSTGGTSAMLMLASQLREGASLTAIETLCNGSISSEPSDPPTVVRPTALIPRPAISTPLYAGDTKVGVLASVVGELVTVKVDGAQVGAATSSGAGTLAVGVHSRLIAGQRVIVDVSLCDVVKSSSPTLVQSTPSVVPVPLLPRKLFECSHSVLVEKCLPNAEVNVFETAGGRRVLIGTGRAQGSGAAVSTVVSVAPSLQRGWRVLATQQVGDKVSADSAGVTVELHPALDAPEVSSPVYACSRCVKVQGVVPGAHVDVSQDGLWVGGAYAAQGSSLVVDVNPPLRLHSTLQVTQTLCGDASSAGKAVVQAAPDPLPVPTLGAAYVYAGSSAVLVGGLVRGTLVEVEEVSSLQTVIGHAPAASAVQVIPLAVPLFSGAQVRVRQRLCVSSDYSPVVSAGYPPEWPLGAGAYGAGFLEVDDIPVSDRVQFEDVTFEGMTFKRPDKNRAMIYYPAAQQEGSAGASIADGRFPLIVVGHARRYPPSITATCSPDVPQDNSRDYTQLSGILSHLAQWGFVSICPDLSWLTADGSHGNREAVMEDAIDYMSSGDQKSGSPFFSKVSTDHIGVLGHSSGGNASVYLGTSGEYSVSVMALLAPAATTSAQDVEQLAAFSPNPALIVYGTEDVSSEYGADGAPPMYFSAAGPPKYMVTISGANHFGFTDSLCLSPPGDGAATISQSDQQRIATAYVTALFARYFNGLMSMDAYLDGERPVEELESFGISIQAQY